jgi:hypothetical protein
VGHQTVRQDSCLAGKMGRAPTLVLCSRNARPEKGLVRRPHLDQRACPSQREKIASFEGSFSRSTVLAREKSASRRDRDWAGENVARSKGQPWPLPCWRGGNKDTLRYNLSGCSHRGFLV